MKFVCVFLTLLTLSIAVNGQIQTLRGTVADYDSKFPLPGVNVILYKDSMIAKVVSTDENGNYRMEGVPVGRNKIKFSYVGYAELTMDNVIVTSGKEVILNVMMNESVREIDRKSVV